MHVCKLSIVAILLPLALIWIIIEIDLHAEFQQGLCMTMARCSGPAPSHARDSDEGVKGQASQTRKGAHHCRNAVLLNFIVKSWL